MVGLFGEWKNFGDVLRIFKWIGIGSTNSKKSSDSLNPFIKLIHPNHYPSKDFY
jgi:hypothetical protein